jgi:hypothetical protein
MQGNTGTDSSKKIMKNQLTFVRKRAGNRLPHSHPSRATVLNRDTAERYQFLVLGYQVPINRNPEPEVSRFKEYFY